MLVFLVNVAATSHIYTLSLHDALPIYFFRADRQRGQIAVQRVHRHAVVGGAVGKQELVEFVEFLVGKRLVEIDRKSTRLNSSHVKSSYAVFCLKTKSEHNALSPAR